MSDCYFPASRAESAFDSNSVSAERTVMPDEVGTNRVDVSLR